MADSYGALIKTTTSTTGTNDYVLETTALTTPHRTPKQAVADGSLTDGDIVQYMARDTTVTGDASFEIGEGIYTDASNEIARDAANVHDGSNGPGALVTWPGSGVRDVYLVVSPSVKIPRLDRSNVFTGGDIAITGGDLGIGVTPPAFSVDIEASAPLMRFGGHATGDDHLIGVDNNGFVVFNQDTSVYGMFIADNGNVAIGVPGGTAPSTKLHVQESTSSAVPTVEIEQLSTGDAALQFSIVGDAIAMGIDNTDDSFKISYASAAGTAVLGTNDRLIIDSSGLIFFPNDTMFGDASVTPDGNVHIHSGSAGSVTADSSADEMILEGSGVSVGMSILSPNTADCKIAFGDVGSPNRAHLLYSHSDDEFNIQSGGTPSLILDSSGMMIGNVTRGTARLKLAMATQDFEIVDSGTVSATEDFWLEVTGNGVTFFFRGFTTK